MDIAEIRQKYPQYSDLSDTQVAQGMHSKFYSDIPYEQFASKIGLKADPVVSEPAAPSSNTSVVLNAANKGVANLPDMILNAPNQVLNLGKAAVGSIAGMAGRPDLMPDLTPNTDLARKGMEAIGMIKPNIIPQGTLQNSLDTLTQGAVGGALTGGASIPRAAIGAGMGAISSGASGAVHGLTDNTALAATAGMLAPAGVAKVIGGGNKLTPQQQLLKDEGVSMTPGQIKGGAVKRIEDAATSIPIVGDVIRGAQKRGIESFDVASINRSLEPIGSKLPRGLVGNKAIEYAYNKLGDAYDALLPKLKGDLNAVPSAGALPSVAGQAAPPSFKQELDGIRQLGMNLHDPQRGQLGRIIDKEIIGRFTPQGLASGETLKDIESKLGKLSKVMGRSDNYDVVNLGDALQEAQAAMRRMVNNVNPQHEGELAKINEGYANFKKVQSAASKVAAQDGVFTPAQLHSSVRSADTSKDKARFSEGNAMMQDLSSAGKSVLSSTVPDSGTPFRAALMYALSNPVKTGLLGIPMAAATIPYTGLGQGATQGFLTRGNNPIFGEVANQVSPIVTGGTLMDILRRQSGQ